MFLCDMNGTAPWKPEDHTKNHCIFQRPMTDGYVQQYPISIIQVYPGSSAAVVANFLLCSQFLNEGHIHKAFIFSYALNSSMTGPLPSLYVANLRPLNIPKLLLTKIYNLSLSGALLGLFFPGSSIAVVLSVPYLLWRCLFLLLLPSLQICIFLLLSAPSLGIRKGPCLCLPCQAICCWHLYLPIKTNWGLGRDL